MRKMNRVLSLLLCMALVIGMLPVGVFATEGTEPVPTETSAATEPVATETQAPAVVAEPEATTEPVSEVPTETGAPKETQNTEPEVTEVTEATEETKAPEAAAVTDEVTKLEVTAPGATKVTVVVSEVTEADGYSAYASYDITVDGFENESGTATVVIPVPEYFDAAKKVTVWEGTIAEGNVLAEDVEIVEGKITFETTHFSVYELTQEAETEPQPTETEPQPTETEPQPTETEPQPTETEPQPTETEPEPTETEPEPTEAVVMDEVTKLEVSAPGITKVTVVVSEVTVPEGYSAYASYDITVEGFENGTATVTLPAPEGFDHDLEVTVWDGAYTEGRPIVAVPIVDGKITFQTTHFSRYDMTQEAVAPVAEEDGKTYLLAGSDFQGENAAANVAAILGQIKTAHTENGQTILLDQLFFAGDYGDSESDTATGVNSLLNAVSGMFPAGEDGTPVVSHVLAQGNRDSFLSGTMAATGGQHLNGYGVYVINEDAFPVGGGNQTTIDALSVKLYDYLHTRMSGYAKEPVFIISHIPLLYSTRTAEDGSGLYANELFEMINNAGHAGLNIFFIHGHGHSKGYDEHLGGEAIYLTSGATVPVPTGRDTWTERTLQFTYMNAGYVGSYYDDTDGSKLTMTLFTISAEGAKVTVERFNKNGAYQLGSAGDDVSVDGLNAYKPTANTAVSVDVAMGTPSWHNVIIYPGSGDRDENGVGIHVVSHHNAEQLQAKVDPLAANDEKIQALTNTLAYSGYYAFDVTVNEQFKAENGFFGTVMVSYPATWPAANVLVYKIVPGEATGEFDYQVVPHKLASLTLEDGTVVPIVSVRAFEGGTYAIACRQTSMDTAPVQYYRANAVSDISSGIYLIAFDASAQQSTDALVLPTTSARAAVTGLYTEQIPDITQYEILGVYDYSAAYEWDLLYTEESVRSYYIRVGTPDTKYQYLLINSDNTISLVDDQTQADKFQFELAADNPDNANEGYSFRVFTQKDENTVKYLSYDVDSNLIVGSDTDGTKSRFVFLARKVFNAELGVAVSNPTIGVFKDLQGLGTAAMYRYAMDANGVDAGVQYLIVATADNYALNPYNAQISAQPITVTANGQEAYTAGRAFEWTFTSTGATNTYYISTVVNGTTYYLRYNNQRLSLTANANQRTAWTVDVSSGSYMIYYDGDWRNYYLTYNASTHSFSSSSSSSSSIRLFSYASAPTEASELYGLADPGNDDIPDTEDSIDGVYPVPATYTEALAIQAVKDDIIVYTSTSVDLPQEQWNEMDDEDTLLQWNFVDTFQPGVPGSYTLSITYGQDGVGKGRISLGTVEVVVQKAEGSFVPEAQAPTVEMSYLDENGERVTGEYKLHLEGEKTFSISTKTFTKETLLTYIQSKVDVYRTAPNEEGAQKVRISDALVDWTWEATPDLDVPGTHALNVTYTYTDDNDTQQTAQLGTIMVNVSEKKVTSYSLSSYTGYVREDTPGTTILRNSSGENIVLTITYSDGSSVEVPVTVDMLQYDDGRSVSTAEPLMLNNLNVFFNGEEVSYDVFTLVIQARVIPDYPEYPDEGAVKVSKTSTGIDFQSSGVAQVELSASGIPVKRGADVIVMVDTSGSMEYTVDYVTREEALNDALRSMINIFQTPGEDGQLLDIQVAMATFNGYAIADSNNDLPYYLDYTKDYIDEELTGGNNVSSWDAFDDNDGNPGVLTGSKAMNADAFVQAADLTLPAIECDGGTNYDYAMDVIYQLGNAIRQKRMSENNGEYDRDLFVIFMSDGATWQWNYFGSFQGTADSSWGEWIAATTSNLPESISKTTEHSYYFDSTDWDGDGHYNEHRMANAIKGSPEGEYTIIRKQPGLGTAVEGYTDLYKVNGLGAKMFSISFCIADARTNGQQGQVTVTKEVQLKSINSLASDAVGAAKYAYDVTTADGLTDAFEAIAGEISYAATQARFLDQMGDAFNLQMSKKTYLDSANREQTITPKIEILSYEIWTNADYLSGEITLDRVGSRKTNKEGELLPPKVLEVVMFSDDGTKAYSSLVDADGDGSFGVKINADGTYSIDDQDDNILADADRDIDGGLVSDTGEAVAYQKGIIYAQTFLYNTNPNSLAIEGVKIPTTIKADGTTEGESNVLPSETFYWKMDTISTSELALRYYVYLTGASEGTRDKGTYATNNFAILYYDNYLEHKALMYTNSPTMAWKSANVSYAFYLVNENGQPIVNQSTGRVGSFANRVRLTDPVIYSEVLLNAGDEMSAMDVIAMSDDVLPNYYKLYDEKAYYHVNVNSNGSGSWQIFGTKGLEGTTYVTQYSSADPSAFSNATEMNELGHDYSHTIVWFAVVWTMQSYPDTVVVDYGLPVAIDVLANDMFGELGLLTGVGEYNPDMENAVAQPSGKYTESYDTTYGSAKVENGKVVYTPNSMAMAGPDVFGYEVNYTGADEAARGHYYSKVTVIPATTIYYEDSFLTLKTFVDGAEAASNWKQVGNADADAKQSEDRPGKFSLSSVDANNVYGFDPAYNNFSEYSLNGAMQTTVKKGTYSTASFTFSGTGFDVISLTSNQTGGIMVTVKDSAGAVAARKLVDTYYGYARFKVEYTYSEGGEWVAGTPVKAANDEVGTDKPEEPNLNDTYTEIVWMVDKDSDNALYQVPVVKIENLAYGTYNVEIRAAYDDLFFHDQNTTDGENSYDFYLDAIRIYNPANINQEGNEEIKDAYLQDGEAWPEYHELRNQILGAASFKGDTASTEVDGVVYIDGKDSSVSISDYQSYGPNNEVYLKPGNAIAFNLDLSKYNVVRDVEKVKTENGEPVIGEDGKPVMETVQEEVSLVADVQIGVKSADGKEIIANVFNINTDNNTSSIVNKASRTISTSTDMYYSAKNQCTNGSLIVLQNTGTGIMAITNIKITYTEDPSTIPDTAAFSLFSISEEQAGFAVMALSLLSDDLPEYNDNVPEATEPEETEPEATEPEATKPEETEPEATEPEATKPSGNKPSGNKPNATEPEETEPEETEPEETEAKETEPEVTEPEATEPEVTEPEATDAAEVPSGEPAEEFAPSISLKTNFSSIKINSMLKLTITTSDDVAYVTVNGITINEYRENKVTGKRTWTIKDTPRSLGDMDISVVAYSNTGVASDAHVGSVQVTPGYTSLRNIISDLIELIMRLF